MRIGIVGFGYEVALIASWLPEGVDIDCFVDRRVWPATSKSVDDILPHVQKGVAYLQNLGVDYIIVPPLMEDIMQSITSNILPLFGTYMNAYVFAQSRVGKLGLLGMHGSSGSTHAKKRIAFLKKTYQLSSYQSMTSSFSPQFPCRTKECSHRQTHLLYATKRTRIMRNLIKDDLRYFKDCAVDTLVPLDRGVWYREKMIRHRLGARMRFHGHHVIRLLIAELLGAISVQDATGGVCRVRFTAYPEDMFQNKKRKQLLDRGGKRELNMHRVVE